MWSWIACYVHGHDYSVSCESGAVFLRCLRCSRRSQGWFVKETPSAAVVAPVRATQHQLSGARR